MSVVSITATSGERLPERGGWDYWRGTFSSREMEAMGVRSAYGGKMRRYEFSGRTGSGHGSTPSSTSRPCWETARHLFPITLASQISAEHAEHALTGALSAPYIRSIRDFHGTLAAAVMSDRALVRTIGQSRNPCSGCPIARCSAMLGNVLLTLDERPP